MKPITIAAAAALVSSAISPAARLTSPANRAFDIDVAKLETHLETDVLRVAPVNGGSWPVTGGRLHHWRGSALIPGARADAMLAFLRNYDHLAEYYAPDLVSSRALRVDPDRATVAMRFKKHKIITVVLDAEFETQSGLAGPTRGYSFSRSTHIWQVEHPGTPREVRLSEGNDDGYLWRLNSYWRFEERPEGLLIECQAVSLTRDVPAAVGWLIMPIIESLPRVALEHTLMSTQKALAANAARRKP